MKKQDKTSANKVVRNAKGQIIQGTANPKGRPKNAFSIKDAIRQRLQNNPEEFEELVTYYLKDRKMRDLLWKMLEGNPPQNVDVSGEIKEDKTLKVILIDGNKTPRITE